MATRVMEITLISARNLNNAVMFSKTKAYAVSWISNNDKSRQWTPVDEDNGTDPTWNQVMNFILNEADLQQGSLLLEIPIYTDTFLGDKEIGRVSVPVKEFLKPAGNNKGDSASPQFVSYQVRKPSGEAKGVLNLSVKLAEKPDFKHQEQPLQEGTRSYGAAKAEPVTGYPAGVNEAAMAEPVTGYPAGVERPAKVEPVTDGPAKAEPVIENPGYPPASSSSSSPTNNSYYQGYPPPPNRGYGPPPPPHHGYPPPPPPHHGYGPPPPPHDGYPPPPPPHHGYGPPPPPPHHGYGPPPPPHDGYPPPPPPHHGYGPRPHHGYPPHHVKETARSWLNWRSS